MTYLQLGESLDLPFYREAVAPALPPAVLDFHAHIWRRQDWRAVPWEINVAGGAPPAGAKYMVTQEDYGAESLLADAKTLFPDRSYGAVCFGYPSPAADLQKTNAYPAQAARRRGLYPLLITGRDSHSAQELRTAVAESGFFGYKVLLNWYGDDYGEVQVGDMIGPNDMAIANELKLVVLLHVPGKGRLADPAVQAGVRALAASYPEASIVLAHCGRAYLPEQMQRSVSAIRDLRNVYVDTAMVMDPTVLQIVFENLDPARVLFATDLPIANMRGRRVYLMDHWVDVVTEGYPESAYRVSSNNLRATYMVYEIIAAIKLAGEMAGLSAQQISDVFCRNGMSLLGRVMEGEQLKNAEARWRGAE